MSVELCHSITTTTDSGVNHRPMATSLHRPSILTTIKTVLFASSSSAVISLRFLSSTRSVCTNATSDFKEYPDKTEHSNPPNQYPINSRTRTRTRTPLEKHFELWIETLKPGFTASDVNQALRAQMDPDLALDIFRWTGQQRGYKHDHSTYLTMIRISVEGIRPRHAETLLEEVLAGACPMSVPLYNSIIRFCCGRRFLFNRAFDVYKKMYDSEDCKPTLETYTMLYNVMLRRFNRMPVSYIYLHSLRSLTKQMKLLGVIPDTYVLNMIIKAYAKCMVVDEAIKVFREMGLYGCEPNAYSYNYIVKGLCEKGRVEQGLRFYKVMREKSFVPSSSTFMILICSLAMERRTQDATDVTLDMLGNSMSPDVLTYKTLLEEMCRDGRGEDAFQLLEDLRKEDVAMGERTYKSLLSDLHFTTREQY